MASKYQREHDMYVARGNTDRATTVATLLGRDLALAGASTGSISGQKPLALTSGSTLTATAPATVATPTTSALVPYVVLT